MLESQIPDALLKSLNRRSVTGTPIDKKQRRGKKQVTEIAQSQSFTAALEEKAFDNFEQDVDDFLDQLDSLGQDLIEKPNRESVDNYRNAIGGFLKKVSKNYAPFEFYSRRRRDTRKYQIWQVMDLKLDELYKGIISRQLTGLMLLDKLHSIKGLIVDLKVGGK